MPLSTDVNLPRSHAAVFPDDCVRCGEPTNGRQMTLMTHTLSWTTWLLLTLGQIVSVSVPACRRCVWWIRMSRWWSAILTASAAFLVLYFLWPHVDGVVARPLQRWAKMGLVLLCLSPWFWWGIYFPPPIEITAYRKSVEYEFADAVYACRFAGLNADAEWVTVEGTDLDQADWARQIIQAYQELDDG